MEFSEDIRSVCQLVLWSPKLGEGVSVGMIFWGSCEMKHHIMFVSHWHNTWRRCLMNSVGTEEILVKMEGLDSHAELNDTCCEP